jgi:hypothetical protein
MNALDLSDSEDFDEVDDENDTRKVDLFIERM